MPNLMWIQTGACSGDSMSLLNAEEPSLEQAISNYKLEILWHPSLSPESSDHLIQLISDINQGLRQLDILCIEGSIMLGPDGTGMYDSFHGRAKKDIVFDLAEKAQFVIGVGSCASYGGVPAAPPNPTDSVGLQFSKDQLGGLLPANWKSIGGKPVINIPGCPAHPNTIMQTLIWIATQAPLELDHLNRPLDFFSTTVHQGCTRNEYHEFDVEEEYFGRAGCLFFNLGCQGPNTSATCNSILWNNQSSKTRAGVPCFGCTVHMVDTGKKIQFEL